MTRQYRPVLTNEDIDLIIPALNSLGDSLLSTARRYARQGEADSAADNLRVSGQYEELAERFESLQSRPTREVSLAPVPGQTTVEDYIEEEAPSEDHTVDDSDDEYHD